MKKDMRISDLEKIFSFRGQILLTEKIKGKEQCRCSFCYPEGKHLSFTQDNIASGHYQAVKIFVPMSEHKFTKLRLQYQSSCKRKEAEKKRIVLEKRIREEKFSLIERARGREHYVTCRHASAPIFRLYPLHSDVYDEFARYIYQKFGKPKFGKQNIEGVHWGRSKQEKAFAKKYGTWTHSRTIGVQIHKGRFEFSVDNDVLLLKQEVVEKARKKNPKIFRKKPGKLV